MLLSPLISFRIWVLLRKVVRPGFSRLKGLVSMYNPASVVSAWGRCVHFVILDPEEEIVVAFHD